MSSSGTSTGSSSHVHSVTDGSSVTSESYTTTSHSTIDPPSQLHFASANQSTVSVISDPSATTTSTRYMGHHGGHVSVFSTVLEETNSALEEASSSFAQSTGSHGGVNVEITVKNSGASYSEPVLPLECDYDVNPTTLYKAIEGKKWSRIEELFIKEPQMAQQQAATWVTRKETNGNLRWRLLPIHAAVIFQSPAPIVAKLLQECPTAARAKDDQGMLPLHLAFRTKCTDWEAIEELISSYPQSIFVKDRKGRSPLECGLAAASAAIASEMANSQNEPPTTVSHAPSLIGALSPKKQKQQQALNKNSVVTPQVQKAMFSVLELYNQIAVQHHLQTAMHASRKTLEERIGAVQESHVATLTKLKKDWESQRHELSRKIQGYRTEIAALKSDFNIQQELLEDKVKTEMELVDKLQQVTTALEAKTIISAEDAAMAEQMASNTNLKKANQRAEKLKRSNKELLLLVETLLDQQNALKQSLDKLSHEANAKNKERAELIEKFLASNEQSVKVTTNYTQDWQSRLNATTIDVSTRLAKILNHNQSVPGDSSTVAATVDVDSYDGEEKKDAHPGTALFSVTSTSTSTGSRDP